MGGNAIATEGGGFVEDGGGTTTITNSQISNNTVYGTGGAIAEDGQGTIKVTRTAMDGNVAQPVSGGACVDAGPNYPTPCAAVANGSGAALSQDGGGRLSVDSSSITNNQATGYGGAAGELLAGSFDAINSTVYANTTTGTVGGFSVGGLSGNFYTEHVALQSDTIDSNSGSSGSGLSVNGSRHTFTVRDTIVSRGSTANCSTATGGTITSLGHNLDDGNSCGFAGTGDLHNTAPALGAAAGTPAVLPEIAGSPTIDAGDATAGCPSIDGPGMPRPDSGELVCDIGAYEFQDTASPGPVPGGSGGGGGGAGGAGGGHSPSPRCTISQGATVQIAKHHKHHKPSKGTLVLRVTCDQAVHATLTWTVVETTKKHHGKAKTKTFHVHPVTASLNAGATTAVNVSCPRRRCQRSSPADVSPRR